jgi:hypothetical protein
MPKWTRLLVIVGILILLAGCGRNFNPFKELGVSNKNIPQYEISSEITDKTPPTQIWSTIEIKDIDETQAKQIQADYIDKKLKENGETIKGITLIVKVKKDQYTAQYVKDEETLKTAVPQAEKPQKFPAIIFFSKVSTK